MVLSSVEFLFLFLPIVLIAYYLPIKNRVYKNAILLISSLGFYAWGEPVFIFIMLFSVAINWLLALSMERFATRKKALLIIAIIWNLSLLGVFKYAGFFADNVNFLLRRDVLSFNIALPLGISFFTFQIMAYIIDVYKGTIAAEKNYLRIALFISFFPKLAVGPILRYAPIADELVARKTLPEDFTRGVVRLTVGLAKRMLLSGYAGYVADSVFNHAGTGGVISSAAAWLGAIAYTIQIYHDFSGYADMAIGLGLMFGFHFPENFNYPYATKSIQEFWSRWHITLSQWFRDYLYFPLGGSRRSGLRTAFNLFVVWFLTGLWHGADWSFVAWGMSYFIIIMIERTTRFPQKLGRFAHVYALLFIVLGRVFFRADSLPLAGEYFASMFGFSGKLTDDLFFMLLDSGKLYLFLGALFSFPVIPWLKKKLPERLWDPLCAVSVVVLLCVSVLACIQGSYNPVIYFNF